MAGERIPHSVPIPLGRESIERPSGLQAAGDRTSHKVFIFCGFAQASADRVFIESGPKTAGIRPSLGYSERNKCSREKGCPFLPSPSSPLSHSSHVVSLFKSFPKFACTEEESCFSEKPSMAPPDLRLPWVLGAPLWEEPLGGPGRPVACPARGLRDGQQGLSQAFPDVSQQAPDLEAASD